MQYYRSQDRKWGKKWYYDNKDFLLMLLISKDFAMKNAITWDDMSSSEWNKKLGYYMDMCVEWECKAHRGVNYVGKRVLV